jgi:hypothetical protein
MSLWERIKKALTREATDIKDTAKRGMDQLEAELERKQRELEAPPHERVDMLLEDIADEEARFGELESRVRSKAADRLEAQGIDPAALEMPGAHPDLALAMEWIEVSAIDPEESLAGDYSHLVWIEEWVGPVIGEDRFANLEGEVKAHALVLDALHEDREQLYVRAPTLTDDEVAGLVAEIIAPAIPDDWEGRLA